MLASFAWAASERIDPVEALLLTDRRPFQLNLERDVQAPFLAVYMPLYFQSLFPSSGALSTGRECSLFARIIVEELDDGSHSLLRSCSSISPPLPLFSSPPLSRIVHPWSDALKLYTPFLLHLCLRSSRTRSLFLPTILPSLSISRLASPHLHRPSERASHVSHLSG